MRLRPGSRRANVWSSAGTSSRNASWRSGTQSRKYDSEATRECILAAACEVLTEEGQDGLSVTQVARRAGVNRGTAYGFFRTREQLIEAVRARMSESPEGRRVRARGMVEKVKGTSSSIRPTENAWERSHSPTPAKRTRRKRDPEATRECVLAAACEVLAQDGKEGLSVAQVARRAGVNRGTAYGYFQTREQLIEAVRAWVSEKLCRAVFGDDPESSAVESISVERVVEELAQFAIENPELGRIWLFEVLSSRDPAKDGFWRVYLSNLKKFASTELAQPGIDAEVQSVLMLAATFLWPVWARAQTTAEERQQVAQRFTREILRHSLHGSLRPEKYPELDARVRK